MHLTHLLNRISPKWNQFPNAFNLDSTTRNPIKEICLMFALQTNEMYH